mmetsp:Transcript_7371/g.13080  ORF Transcript_7371/g.13080 Transcript_7371/m.13080 type:complete len:214 (+) Transcript_7371:259-900(+)
MAVALENLLYRNSRARRSEADSWLSFSNKSAEEIAFAPEYFFDPVSAPESASMAALVGVGIVDSIFAFCGVVTMGSGATGAGFDASASRLSKSKSKSISFTFFGPAGAAEAFACAAEDAEVAVAVAGAGFALELAALRIMTVEGPVAFGAGACTWEAAGGFCPGPGVTSAAFGVGGLAASCFGASAASATSGGEADMPIAAQAACVSFSNCCL